MKGLILTAGLALSMNVFAEDVYTCTHYDATRIIEVVYDNPGELVPCEVKYTKASGVQTLWRAESQVGYCEEKAAAFADKQEGLGWSCEQISDQAMHSLDEIEEYHSTEAVIESDSTQTEYDEEVIMSDSTQTEYDEEVIMSDSTQTEYDEEVIMSESTQTEYDEEVIMSDSMQTESEEQVTEAEVIHNEVQTESETLLGE